MTLDQAVSDERLAAALEGAHLATLLMVLIHLTGDRERWLAERCRPDRPRGARDDDDGGLPDDVQAEIRAAAHEAIAAWRDGRRDPVVPTDAELVEMASFAIGEPVDPGQATMLAEEIGLRDRDEPWALGQTPAHGPGPHVAIVGAGFSGLCLAIKLERARVPYVILEKNATVGGTWLENRYPGCAVDSPSHLYQYSFEHNPDWPHFYSRRGEILGYLERCADRYDVRRHIRFATEVRAAAWDDERAVWSLRLSDAETLDVPVLVMSVGQLNRPAVPALPGAETFAGPALHTAAWDPGLDVTDKRVAVIGTGASAMQLVPAIAGVAERVTVLQRSPQWAVPNPNLRRAVPADARWLLGHVPFYAGWYRFRQFWLWNDNIWPTLQIDPDWPYQERSINEANEAHRVFLTRHIERTLEGRPDLLEKCLPDYPPYGKRMLMDVGWFDTMLRDDVELVTEPIERIVPGGVRTADGAEHAADVLVYATGFEAKRLLWPIDLRGRGGVSIRDAWGDDDARAYLGMAMPRFPNLLCTYGPNTNLGHGGSVVFHAELQVRYIMGMLRAMADRDLATFEVREDVHDAYNERVDAAHDRMIWSHRGMDTWYRNAQGRIVTNSPWRLVDYWRMTLRPDLTDFHVTHANT